MKKSTGVAIIFIIGCVGIISVVARYPSLKNSPLVPAYNSALYGRGKRDLGYGYPGSYGGTFQGDPIEQIEQCRTLLHGGMVVQNLPVFCHKFFNNGPLEGFNGGWSPRGYGGYPRRLGSGIYRVQGYLGGYVPGVPYSGRGYHGGWRPGVPYSGGGYHGGWAPGVHGR